MLSGMVTLSQNSLGLTGAEGAAGLASQVWSWVGGVVTRMSWPMLNPLPLSR